jgi:phosphatidylserine/phosphatidylglycerophosphate/cardiolipin synthase-like enzyme
LGKADRRNTTSKGKIQRVTGRRILVVGRENREMENLRDDDPRYGINRRHSMDFVRQHRPISLALIAGKGHYEAVVKAAMGAERSLWIATANLKELMVEDESARPGRRRTLRRAGEFRSMLEVLAEQVEHGGEVRILHASPASGPFQKDFRRLPALRRVVPGRFEMRLCPRVHFKAVVVDGTMLYLGSANWTGAGLGAKGEGRRNFELGFVSRDDLLLDEVQAFFDRIWSGAECGVCKLRQRCPAPLDRKQDRKLARR